MLKIFNLFILLWIFPHISCQWGDPYFEAADTEHVTIKPGTNYVFTAHEEIKVPFNLAIINNVGLAAVEIGEFTFGSNSDLGIDVMKRTGGDSRYDLVVTKFQDYEKIPQNMYRLEIKVGGVPQIIQLYIINLIDTFPIVQYDGPCLIEELLDEDTITDCTFEVTVEDGFTYAGVSGEHSWINTITPELFDEADELFAFEHQPTLDTAKLIYYKIKLKKKLHYDEKPFYNFRSHFKNSMDLSASVLTIIELIDIANMPPIWRIPFAIQTFDEKSYREFIVEATDGDTGINDEILFDIEFDADVKEKYKDWIFIKQDGRNTAKIYLPNDELRTGIDRDLLENEIYRFTIIAHKTSGTETFTTPSSALIVVNDINDQTPLITIECSTDCTIVDDTTVEISIFEERFLTLPFSKITVHDRDLEKNAMYSVRLDHTGDTDYSNPFNIVPGNGYQKSEFFKIDVYQNENLLDFENKTWRSFEIQLIAEETDTDDKWKDKKIIKVKLINWNDELPIFENDGVYTAEVLESIPANEFIIQVKANDRDVGDNVHHSILGNLDLLDIDDSTGKITTNKDNTFDYEKQTQVVLQIMAEDELVVKDSPSVETHKVFAQLTINVIDVNDETPELKMPPTPEIEENVPGGTTVGSVIRAFDPDTTAELIFSIDWDESSATKLGQQVKEEIQYQEWFIIVPIPEVGTNNILWGQLTVNPDFVKDGKEVDYEEVEVLYLTIVVEDVNQEIGIGTASAQLTVRLIDLNDNAPKFTEDSLTVERNVLEEALTGTPIGTIFAEDIDGPKHNIITYTLTPADDTIPDDWVAIDQKGVMRVNTDKAIDCDKPDPRPHLEYIVELYDQKHKTTGNIKIIIIDTNNKIPQVFVEQSEVWIKENVTVTGEEITKISATDLDRDDKHCDISYLIDSSYDKAGRYFAIDRKTGELKVELNGGAVFDFDTGDKEYDIPIEVYDSALNVVNRNTTNVKVYLIDVNNHAPEFLGEYSPKIPENSAIDTQLDELCASDLDSGANAEISFQLVSIAAADGVTPTPPNDLFKIQAGSNEDCMRLAVASNLKSYYGTWAVTIMALDNGIADLNYGQQNTTETFFVEITPYNYENPKIIYPTSTSIRLSDSQVFTEILKDANNDPLRPFEVYDPDGGEYGLVDFSVTATLGQDQSDADFFMFQKLDGKTSNLRLTKPIGDQTVFHITCKAVDGGGKPSESLDLKITFVNIDGDPYFEIQEDFAFFKEKEAGLLESYTTPEGKLPINEGLPENEYEKVYYFLANTETANYFELDHITRVLKLKNQLDRSDKEKHTLKIILSREEGSAPTNPSDSSILTLNILVVKEDTPTVDPTKPIIFYPFTSSLRLLAGQEANGNLLDASKNILRSFEAFGRNADTSSSDITFKIANVPGVSQDANYFRIIKTDSKTLSNLQLAKEVDHVNPFNIRITAENSLGQTSEPFDLKITFVNMDGSPYFETLTDLVFISENETGLIESYDIPKAIEPRNEGLEDDLNLEKLYYFIDSTYNQVDILKFNLNSETGQLTLREMLDRELIDQHEIRIIVSRFATGPPANSPVTSMLLLTIMVLDVNDNPPVFERKEYGAGITTTDRIGKTLLQVKANDLDLNETITYHLLTETFQAKGEGIDAVEVTSFSVNSENNLGNVVLNFVPKSAMIGHFEFQIEARDNDNVHQDRTLMKVYIIADANRVTFVFVNSVDDIEFSENTKFILDLFKAEFNFECNIDEVVPATDENGVAIDNLTNVRVHFIKDNEAISAEEIQRIASDVLFITKLKSALAQRQLILQEVPTGSSIGDDTNKAELLQTILIVLSVVLGILCAVLIIAFFIRTRNLRRQLKAMSTVDFGSTSSNLNRREAPTTNVFSVEGSNPVLNNNNLSPVFDNISVHSDESDFAGIQDDPTFKHRKDSINPTLIEEMRRKSVNPMVNGNVIEEIRRKSVNPMVNGNINGSDGHV